MDDVFHKHESPFRGRPRPELDSAWQNLMKGSLLTPTFLFLLSPGQLSLCQKASPFVFLIQGGLPRPIQIIPWFSSTTGRVMGWLSRLSYTRSIVWEQSVKHFSLSTILLQLNAILISAARWTSISVSSVQAPSQDHRYWQTHFAKIIVLMGKSILYPNSKSALFMRLLTMLHRLRQAAMCHADMTLMTYEWWDRSPHPQVVHGSAHVCANWDKLTNWIQNHNFNSHGDILVHPKTGQRYFDPYCPPKQYWPRT